jgi:hypothetical protein
MEQFIVDNGRMGTDMVMEYKYGQMVQNMKDTGVIIKLMERVNFGMQMVMYLMENGKKIKLMDSEYIHM